MICTIQIRHTSFRALRELSAPESEKPESGMMSAARRRDGGRAETVGTKKDKKNPKNLQWTVWIDQRNRVMTQHQRGKHWNHHGCCVIACLMKIQWTEITASPPKGRRAKQSLLQMNEVEAGCRQSQLLKLHDILISCKKTSLEQPKKMKIPRPFFIPLSHH